MRRCRTFEKARHRILVKQTYTLLTNRHRWRAAR